jgi:hypothetical protein
MNNTTNEPTLEQIKQSLDIVQVAEMYGELKKAGANFIYKNDKSITINPAKQIFSDFNGNITGGSVLDLVMYMEKLDLKAGIERLKELSSLDTYKIDPSLQIKRKEEAKKKKKVDFAKLELWGQEELKLVGAHRPIEYQDKNENTLHFSVPVEMQKLFETKMFTPEYKEKIDYIFLKLVGWNKHFNCPSIILYDYTGKIVDLIAYRPIKPEKYKNWSNPKYIYKNSHNRGENFLYPFRKEVQPIIEREKYLIVGEGIKNGLNALFYSVPFITLESSSNKIDDALIQYIRNYHSKGFNIICMFDGDAAGAKAFENFKLQVGLNVDNFLKFDSGLDFVDYLQSEDK